MTIRRRAALELSGLAVTTALYLGLFPARPIWVDLGLALVGLGLVAADARASRARVWGTPPAPRSERLRHAALHLGIGTLTVALLFAAIAVVRGATLARPTFVLALTLFVPWAWLQQILLQSYLLGRLRALLPEAPPAGLAALNGLIFGLVHLPDAEVTALTIVGGAVWSWYYLRDRCLTPIALSHAMLGTAYYYWIREHDLVLRWFSSLQ